MKKWFIILTICILPGFSLMAQNDDDSVGGKIQERMREYIQQKLSLSKSEAEKFNPLFLRYFREFAQTYRANKGDRLVLQQKIIELRLRYRNEFRQIMDENKANKVFRHEDEFRTEAGKIIRENQRTRASGRRFRMMQYKN